MASAVFTVQGPPTERGIVCDIMSYAASLAAKVNAAGEQQQQQQAKQKPFFLPALPLPTDPTATVTLDRRGR